MSVTTTSAPNETQEAALGQLTLLGSLTARNIRQAHADLLEVMRRHTHVRIDCSAVTDADVSFIQLILAARRSAAAEGKTISLARPASGALLVRLMQAGLVGLDAGEAEQAFWHNKESANG
jgi:anti-anti-sigma regulatory factor